MLLMPLLSSRRKRGWSTSRDRGHRTGPLVEHRVGKSGYLCIIGRMQPAHGIQKENGNKKLRSAIKARQHILMRGSAWVGP